MNNILKSIIKKEQLSMCAHYLLTSVSLLKKWMQEYSEEEVNGIEEVVAYSEVAEPIGEETVDAEPKPKYVSEKKVERRNNDIEIFHTFAFEDKNSGSLIHFCGKLIAFHNVFVLVKSGVFIKLTKQDGMVMLVLIWCGLTYSVLSRSHHFLTNADKYGSHLFFKE